MPHQWMSHATGTPPWLLRPVTISTSSELYPDYFLLPTFLECSCIQLFNSPLTKPVDYTWQPTTHCAAPVFITECHAMPMVTGCFSLNAYLGKQRISLGVTTILSMCLCSHT